MKNRIKEVYLMLGHVLNNPKAFGMEERMPKSLEGALSQMQHELLKELREEASDQDTLTAELSQDADRYVFPAVSVTSFSLHSE